MSLSASPAQRFTLRNSGGKDITFDGWSLGAVSSKSNESATWQERAVYQTEAGTIICHKLDRSTRQGAVDQGQVAVFAKPPMGHTLQERAAQAERPMKFTELFGAPETDWQDTRVADWFRGAPLSKELLDILQIEDVEEIE